MPRQQRQILKEARLRSTASRTVILGLFLHSTHALSYSDIERELCNSFDRVTVYRTLKTFLDKGIVHKILDDEGGLRYALCSNHCRESGHRHNHIHFKCGRCGLTSCLDEVEVPDINLPAGYKMEAVNLLIQGTCLACQ